MREWTDSEDEVLRQHYLSKPRDWPEWDELLPGRSAKSRKSRAIRLGMRLREVSRVGTRSRVTDEQILQAIDGYWVCDIGTIMCGMGAVVGAAVLRMPHRVEPS